MSLWNFLGELALFNAIRKFFSSKPDNYVPPQPRHDYPYCDDCHEDFHDYGYDSHDDDIAPLDDDDFIDDDDYDVLDDDGYSYDSPYGYDDVNDQFDEMDDFDDF